MLKVGINGFGRIGRAIFRINLKKKLFNVVAINDINPSCDNMSYLLKYDSHYGGLSNDIKSENDSIIVDSNVPVDVYHKKGICDVPWQENDVDVVIDSSGVHENLILARKLSNTSVKHCIVTHSPDEVDKTIIFSVNEEELCADHFMVSSSICDANAFTPVMNVLHREFTIEHGFLTTLHPWLEYQNILDGPSRSFAYPGAIHEHFPLGRASTESIIPKTTSCISASSKVLDFLDNKFQCLSYRIPTPLVSSADVSVKLEKKTTKQDVIELFKAEQSSQKIHVFHNNFEPLVSKDFVGMDYSVILDHRWTAINQFNYLKLILWYDNEWGYGSRVVDLVRYIENLYS